jgi:CHC2 zinc finger
MPSAATERVLSRLSYVASRGGSTWKALCPAHDDQDPSLSITEGDNGRVLLHCFAGCDERAILQAMGLTFRDLFPGELSSNGAALGQ